ncbi:MAG TPA: YerC/YecD family TrpR-related protein [Xylella sp.]
MKQRPVSLPHRDASASLEALAEAFACLDDRVAIAAFLRDLCTPAELEALADRWRVVPLLLEGRPYREIHDHTGISVTTIGRVARSLEHGAGGYAAALRVLTKPSAGVHREIR